MSDIYKQKAKKYKYKYLKLKKEIEGGQISIQKYVQKYVVQDKKKNQWINIPDKQIKLINSSELNELNNLNELSEYKYIYDDIENEIINIKNKKRQKCLLLNLPTHNGAKINEKINIDIINKIININNIKPTVVIDNKYIVKDFHNLYYIQSDSINEWENSEEWQKNILPLLCNKNNIDDGKQNTIILNFLSTEYYLLFIYNKINYISFISKIDENSVQFIIINLVTGDSRIIYYPLLIYQKKITLFGKFKKFIKELTPIKRITPIKQEEYSKQEEQKNREKENSKQEEYSEQEDSEQKKQEDSVQDCTISFTKKINNQEYKQLSLRFHPDKNLVDDNNICPIIKKIDDEYVKPIMKFKISNNIITNCTECAEDIFKQINENYQKK